MSKKYRIEHLFPPFFCTVGGQRYLGPGWIPVDDSVTLDDVEHVKPAYLTKTEKVVGEVVGSKGDKYIVTERGGDMKCTCPGFKFRGKCKHLEQVL